ncbi:class I SAM-dependent methyltransferase [Kribbella qitaiheensis]|uniref:Class I SAM-dependent methyltransferase n=1 Tax=Kribbella qitaiheensis TaxID=1544730 RepID=A0A7G6WT44_9ACTN|nr:class I SAM-dependent methyltransferase [Kribbella qitaiheensis]QNE17159.1 class I SAM-dependent methyltransferase [Kribbella qitaiheensis]
MRSSVSLYDALAATYEDHFAAPHRKAYDDLAWEACCEAIGTSPGVVIDVGCGVGRWSRRFLGQGHRVIGIEPAPRMSERAACLQDENFTLLRDRVEQVTLPAGNVDAVVAMGSLQYTADPAATIAHCAAWLRPGGVLCVLVDSLFGLVVELVRADKGGEAMERLYSRRGVWRIDDQEADLHLLDVARLGSAFVQAGLEVTSTSGLLVGASLIGRDDLVSALNADYDRQLGQERVMADFPELADLGKQLLVIGRRTA